MSDYHYLGSDDQIQERLNNAKSYGRMFEIGVLEEILSLRAEIAKLKGRNNIDPVARLHNLCDGLAENAKESPFSQAEWDRMDAENVRLTNEMAETVRLCAKLPPLAGTQLDVANAEKAEYQEQLELIAKELGDAGIAITEAPFDGVMVLINQRHDLHAKIEQLSKQVEYHKEREELHSRMRQDLHAESLKIVGNLVDRLNVANAKIERLEAGYQATGFEGWPIGSTAYSRLETDKFREWLRQHGGF
jgi:hypothetical protein